MRRELGYIQESDLDLLLVLDARVGGPITRHLLERAGFSSSGEVDSCRSTLRSSDGRETDVEISWPGGGLVVEDKVDAVFQPGQPESYAAEVRRRQGEGETVASVLIAPSRRLPELELTGARHFSLVVTCDELAEVAEADGGELGRAAAIVYRAAEEHRPSGVVAEDPALSAWGDDYRAVIASALPPGASLIVGPESLRAVGREFAVILLEEAERDLVWKFGHWIPGGHVRMELAPGIDPGDVSDGLRVVPKKAQRWVVADTPPIDFGTPAAQQQDAIEQAVSAALVLRAWARSRAEQDGER